MINSHDGIDISTFDIPNTFIQTKADNEEDTVTIRLRGELSEYLVMIAPEMYNPYVVIEQVINIYI